MDPNNPRHRPAHLLSPVQPGARRRFPVGLVVWAGIVGATAWNYLNPLDAPDESRSSATRSDSPPPSASNGGEKPTIAFIDRPGRKATGLLQRTPRDLFEALTASDYPADALRRDQEGATAFTLDIDPAGVPSCTVTQSSGVASLDETTCAVLERRRFVRADSPTRISSRVRWVLPR